jgi:multicomponent Na+:H+ antiporter subunit B
MSSIILRTATRFLIVLLTLESVFILLRGHNEPGGGFIGGLLIASGFALYALAFGPQESRALLQIDPRSLIASGLLAALLSGCIGLVWSEGFLKGLWLPWPIPGVGKAGTVLLFDLGVYLVVWGTALLILFTLDEEDR